MFSSHLKSVPTPSKEGGQLKSNWGSILFHQHMVHFPSCSPSQQTISHTHTQIK